jgi:hypothetical protein
MTAAKDLLTTEGKFLMKSMSRLTPEGDKAAWARDFIAEPKYGTVHGGGWRCSVYDRRWIADSVLFLVCCRSPSA